MKWVIFIFLILVIPLVSADLTDNIVASWSLDDTAEDVNGYNLTAYNNPSWQTEGSGNCKVGGCVFFNVEGSSGPYLDAGDEDDFDGSNKMTWSYWIYPDTFDSNARGHLCKRTSPTIDNSYYFFSYIDGELYIAANAESAQDTNMDMGANSWKHMTITYDGTQGTDMKVYLNGVYRYGKAWSATSIPATGSSLRFGTLWNNPGYTQRFSGYMDEVVIWKDRVLTQTEISEIYNADRGLAYPFNATLNITEGLQTYHSFNNASVSGSTSIDSTGSVNGTIIGATTGVEGKIGEAFSFDGTSDRVDLGNNAGANPYSLSAWVKTTTKDNGRIIDRRATSPGTKINYITAVNTDGFVTLTHRSTDGTVYSAIGTTDIADGEWHHVVATFGRYRQFVYVDGVMEVNPTAANPPYTDSQTTLIGDTAYDYSRPFTGILDEVAVWNRQIGTNEVIALYNNGTGFAYPFVDNTAPSQTVSSPANGTSTFTTPILFNATCTDVDGDSLTWFLENGGSPVYNNTGATPLVTLYNATLTDGNLTFTSWCNDGTVNSSIATIEIEKKSIYEGFNCSVHPLPFCTRSWDTSGDDQCYECGSLRKPIDCFGDSPSCSAYNWSIKYE